MQLRDVLPIKSTKVVVEQQLDEINMSPTSLRQLAGAITGAQAGMEFEMIVPGVENPDGGEQEPDYDQDERVDGIDDAVNFFDDGDHNTSRDLQRLRDRMQGDYQDWLFNEFANRWDADSEEFVYDYIRNNLDASEVAEVLGLDDEESSALADNGIERKHWQAAASKIVEDSIEPYLDDAREDAESDFLNGDQESDWLEHEGITSMTDVENTYGNEINWPHWTSSSNGGEGSVEGTAQEFESMIGKPVKWSNSYHGAQRDATSYVVEPDGSLEGEDDDTGLEFVSPPMPINDMLADLDKTVKWAGRTGCYTNDSTGLHINVSVPGTEDSQNIDYVKLALLLGDDYILEQFGRAGNTYCKSGMAIIKERVVQRPEDAQVLLEKMRTGLDAMASKLIHSGNTQKFTSINMKGGYVEFRSPGGDWLEEYSSGKGKIENALLRFVVALDAAVKPELYKQEYLKKLYAMLQPKGENDTIAYFAKFAAGTLPKAALKSFVRQAQLERKGIKDTYNELKPAGQEPNYYITNSQTGETLAKYYAATNADAFEYLQGWKAQNPSIADVKYGKIMPGAPIPGSTLDLQQQRATNSLMPSGPGPWEIYRISDASSVRELSHTNRAAAESEARSALGLRGEAPELYGVRTRQGAEPTQSSMPTQTWTGQWIIKDAATGRDLYKFGGIGNSQSDANRHAAQWARDNQRGGEIDVVPEMA